MTSAQRQPSLPGVRARLAWALWAESSCGADHPGHGLSTRPHPEAPCPQVAVPQGPGLGFRRG